MKIFVFDTETTGLPIKDACLDKQPYIIQFSALLVNVINEKTGEFEEIKRIDYIIKPPVPIPFATSQVHGIYDKDVIDKQEFSFFIDDILDVIQMADIIVGHNLSFDEEMLNYELKRNKREGYYNPRQRICTMQSSRNFCKLQGRWLSFKAPKLNELYLSLFGKRFSWAHNAMIDVESTLKCFIELLKLGVIKIEKEIEMRLF